MIVELMTATNLIMLYPNPKKWGGTVAFSLLTLAFTASCSQTQPTNSAAVVNADLKPAAEQKMLKTALQTGAPFKFKVAARKRRVSLEGVGIDIRAADKNYLRKGDHLDTASFKGGLIFPGQIPAPVTKNMEYATRDFRPLNEDPRADHIDRIKADAAGDLLIAMPSSAATNGGWTRLSTGDKPDFLLDYANSKGQKPDPKSPYWFYKHSYDSPNAWLSLPKNSAETKYPPFVFAKKNELYWENPPEFTQGNVVVIAEKKPLPQTTVANPVLLVQSNGDYLASISGAEGAKGKTGLWKSTDKGKTWALLADDFALNRHSMFEHRGNLYMIGLNTDKGGGTRIYKSSDNGKTWATNAWPGQGGDDAPSQVVVAHGRIWKAAWAGDGEGGNGPGFYSAPVDADLMKKESWTLSAPTPKVGPKAGQEYKLANGQAFKSGNEGTLLSSKSGALYNLSRDSVYRPGVGWQPGLNTVQVDLNDISKLKWDPNYAGSILPGNWNGKSTAIYDPVSQTYWALTSGGYRVTLDLYSAGDENGRIGDFQFKRRVLEGNSFNEGFNYPFVQIDGDDLVFVLRTAWETNRGKATRWHDGNLFTFHRVANFRRLLKETPKMPQ